MAEVEEIEIDIDNEDAETYIEYDLQIYPSDYTLKVIKDMWDDGDIEIPEFQRNFVWTIKQSSIANRVILTRTTGAAAILLY